MCQQQPESVTSGQLVTLGQALQFLGLHEMSVTECDCKRSASTGSFGHTEAEFSSARGIAAV